MATNDKLWYSPVNASTKVVVIPVSVTEQTRADDYVNLTNTPPYTIIEVIGRDRAVQFVITPDNRAVAIGEFLFNPFKSTFNNELDAVAEFIANGNTDGFLTYEATLIGAETASLFIIEMKTGKVLRSLTDDVRAISAKELTLSGSDGSALINSISTLADISIIPQADYDKVSIIVPVETDDGIIRTLTLTGTMLDDRTVPLVFTFNVSDVLNKIIAGTDDRAYLFYSFTTTSGVTMYCRVAGRVNDKDLSLYIHTFGRTGDIKHYGLINKCKGTYYGNL